MRAYLLLLLFVPAYSFGQKKDTVFRYLDENLQLTTKAKAAFYGVSIKQVDHWYLYAIYSDTTPLIKANFKDKQLQVKHGYFCLYYPQRKKAQEGMYTENKKNGVWQSWYESGNHKDSGSLSNNLIVNEWKVWHENGQLYLLTHYKDHVDPVGAVTMNLISPYGVKQGLQKTWYADGVLESEGNFENDQMHGEWKWYHENGKLSTIEYYNKGKVTEMKCFDSTGNETGDFCSIAKPALLKGHGNYKDFIRAHLLWPEEAVKKKIEGVVKARFRVDKWGMLKDLKLEGNSPLLKKAVEDLFLEMKEWYPAISHNRAVEWEEEIDIPFFLN